MIESIVIIEIIICDDWFEWFCSFAEKGGDPDTLVGTTVLECRKLVLTLWLQI